MKKFMKLVKDQKGIVVVLERLKNIAKFAKANN